MKKWSLIIYNYEVSDNQGAYMRLSNYSSNIFYDNIDNPQSQDVTTEGKIIFREWAGYNGYVDVRNPIPFHYGWGDSFRYPDKGQMIIAGEGVVRLTAYYEQGKKYKIEVDPEGTGNYETVYDGGWEGP